MPRFQYVGRDPSGKMMQGILDAASESTVATQLIRKGISPITIEAYIGEVEKVEDIATTFKIGYPGIEDLAFLSRQLYSLTRSGVPVVRALRVVAESSKNQFLKLALGEVIVRVEEGSALALALSQHPKIFPSIMIALVNVGENTGSLDAVFNQLAIHFERERATRMRIKSATRYPIIVLAVIVIAFVIINVFVIPAFSAFFKQFHAELPLPTLILIGISDFTIKYWYVMVTGLFILLISIFYYLRSTQGKYNWDKWKLKIPIFGDIINRTLLGRFSRTFALCIRTGVPLLDSIGLISKAIDNVYVGGKIGMMKNDIEHGTSLTLAAANSKMFSPLVLQMLSIGEETGEIDRLLDEMATYYEEEVDYDVKRLSDLLEPIILAILAVMVLVLALGVYLPMWDISKAVLKH